MCVSVGLASCQFRECYQSIVGWGAVFYEVFGLIKKFMPPSMPNKKAVSSLKWEKEKPYQHVRQSLRNSLDLQQAMNMKTTTVILVFQIVHRKISIKTPYLYIDVHK